MKSALLALIVLAFTIGAAAAGPAAGSWMGAIDARPEAIITGSSLLLLASILRRHVTHRRLN